jgi:AcrR family transcriptional regulator
MGGRMSPTKGEERRQRRGEQRREEILAAAAQVFAAKGYHGATTREIAEAADLAEGTIFNYFPTKRDLVVAVFEQSADRLREATLNLDLTAPVRQALTDVFDTLLAFFAENRLYVQAIAAETWTDPELLHTYGIPRIERLAGRLRAFLRLQITARRLRAFDVDLGVRLVLGMITALVLPMVRGVRPPPEPAERRLLAAQVVDLLLNGVGVPGEG